MFSQTLGCFTLLISCILAAHTITEEVKYEDLECSTSEQYKENDCSNCTCLEDGTSKLLCNLKICDSSLDETLKNCSLGSTWTSKCNKCWCVVGIGTVCTTRECGDVDSEEDVVNTEDEPEEPEEESEEAEEEAEEAEEEAEQEEFECEPSEVYIKNNCQICGCLKEKELYCNSNSCPTVDKTELKNCTIGTSWLNACNKCWCVTGPNTMCTTKDCRIDDLKRN